MASQVTLYADKNFQGASIVITGRVNDLRTHNFNDKASSAIVEGERWGFCAQVGGQGTVVTFDPGEYSDLGLSGLNDTLSSLYPMGPAPTEQVIFVQPPSGY